MATTTATRPTQQTVDLVMAALTQAVREAGILEREAGGRPLTAPTPAQRQLVRAVQEIRASREALADALRALDAEITAAADAEARASDPGIDADLADA